MIHYQIVLGSVISIEIENPVNDNEMESLSFTLEALAEGNPKASINFKLQAGLPIRWITYVERLCEDISNFSTIERKSGKIAIQKKSN